MSLVPLTSLHLSEHESGWRKIKIKYSNRLERQLQAVSHIVIITGMTQTVCLLHPIYGFKAMLFFFFHKSGGMHCFCFKVCIWESVPEEHVDYLQDFSCWNSDQQLPQKLFKTSLMFSGEFIVKLKPKYRTKG